MKVMIFIRNLLIIFVIVFIISTIVSYLYSLIVHGNGQVDWESSVRLALIFGIIFPTLKMMEERRKD